MSINWLMTTDNASDPFVFLPGEQRLLVSPPRVSFTLQSLNKYPGRGPFSLTSSSGKVYLTTRRIVYIPDTKTDDLKNFAAPMTNLHDSRVTAPWFGPNEWVALVQPVPNGGIPPAHSAVELRMTFKDGGAYDFHTKFCQIKERVQQAADVGRVSGMHSVQEVNLEQLPVYQESEGQGPAPTTQTTTTSQSAPSTTEPLPPPPPPPPPPPAAAPAAPSEPPPGYEEAQREGVFESFERGLRLHNELS